MTKNLWIYAGVAVVLIVGSGLTYSAGVSYLPSILMFIAALAVLGISMTYEDALLAKYDTPHDDDSHPPQLIFLRAGRATVLLVMGILIFVMVF